MRKFAAFVVDRAWWVIGFTLLLTLVLGSRLPHLRIDDTVETFFLEGDPSLEFYNRYLDKFETDEFFLVAIKTGDAYSPETLGMIRRIAARIEALAHVEDVMSLADVPDIRAEGDDLVVEPLIGDADPPPEARAALHERAKANPLIVGNVVSEDAKTAAIFVRTDHLSGDSEYRKVLTREVRAILKEEIPGGVEVHVAGGPIFYTIYIEYVGRDLTTFTPVSMLVLSLLMVLLFRRWRAVWLPMACILAALIWTLGVLELAGLKLSLVTNIIPPLLLVIGLAVIVHVLNRYGEWYRELGDRREALIETVAHLMHPCFLTSLTTSVGFGSLAVSRIAPIRQTGLLAALGVMVTFAISMTLVPAILSRLDPPKDTETAEPGTGRLGRFLAGCADLVAQRPGTILLASVAITAIGTVGLFKLKVETNLIEYFKPTSEIRSAYDFLQHNVSGANSFEVFVEGDADDAVLDPDALRAIEKTQRRLEAEPFITHTQSLADLVKMMNRAMHEDDPAYDRIPDTRAEVSQLLLLLSLSDDRGGLDLFTDESYSYTRISARMTTVPSPEVRRIIGEVNAFAAAQFPPGFRVEPTGEVPLYVAMEKNLVEGQLRSFGIALAIIIGCVMVLFGSVRVGIYSIFPNVAPIVMTLGVMGIAGIPINLATCMIPSIAIGIAVDDTIHLLARFRGEYRRTGGADVAAALRTTLTTTGRAMVVTSIVLFFGFLVLLTSQFQPNFHFGVLTAFTMAWALAADLLTTPALLVWFRPKRF